MKRFEVGETYRPCAFEFDPITVLKRTAKTIWADNGQTTWRMRIRQDADGNEYAVDSAVPPKWRDAFTYRA